MLTNNCRLLYEHKRVQGVSVPTTAFFTVWGLWNLYFYPSCHLWLSFAGGICLAAVNVIWVSMACYYHNFSRRHSSSRPAEIKEYRKPPLGNRVLKGLAG